MGETTLISYEPVKEVTIGYNSLKEGDATAIESENAPKDTISHTGGTMREVVHVQQEKAPPPIWNIVTRGKKGKDIEVGDLV